jgi:hypothetical protein
MITGRRPRGGRVASPPRSVLLAAGPPPTHNRHVSIPPDSTRTGRDGKSYPAQMPPPLAWRWRAVTLTHRLCHELGYSQRAAQRELPAAATGAASARSATT